MADNLGVKEPPATLELRRAPLHRYCGIAQRPGRIHVPGTYVWCGHLIELIDPSDYRRAKRTRHRGDRYELAVSVGGRAVKRNCRRAFNFSTIYGARDLIKVRLDPCCAECGCPDGNWEADHIIPLIDGGPHCPTNIQRLCNSCHSKKSSFEARERASRRRSPSPPGTSFSLLTGEQGSGRLMRHGVRNGEDQLSRYDGQGAGGQC